REYVEAGGLMSYGPNLPDLLRRAADYVDKILRGAKPGDIPVEQPTKFDLIINLATAKALGLTIPEPFLLRPDELLESPPAASSSRCSAVRRPRGRSRRARLNRAHASRSSRSILTKTKGKTSQPSSMACVLLAMSQAKTWTSITATPRATRRG